MPGANLGSHEQKGVRKVDHGAPEDPVRRQARLIGIRSEYIHSGPLLHRLEQTECSGIGVVVQHVGPDTNERQGRLSAGGDIVEAVEVDLPALGLGSPRGRRSANPGRQP